MDEKDLLPVCNHILLKMENPYDSVHVITIGYYNSLGKKLETEQYYLIRDFLEKEKGFIEKVGSNLPGSEGAQYRLTEKGKTVVSMGSIELFTKKERKKKTLTDIKEWLGVTGSFIGILGGVIGAIAGLFTLLNNDSKEIEELNIKIHSIENTIRLNNERYIEQQKEYVKHIDSLNYKINELKSKR